VVIGRGVGGGEEVVSVEGTVLEVHVYFTQCVDYIYTHITRVFDTYSINALPNPHHVCM